MFRIDVHTGMHASALIQHYRSQEQNYIHFQLSESGIGLILNLLGPSLKPLGAINCI